MLGKESNEKRERENIILKAEMQKELARMGDERSKSGKPEGIFKEGMQCAIFSPTRLSSCFVLTMQNLSVNCR
jgi:hypothetical protein